MYWRSESGEGIARNLASHSRWALADAAVKPRRSSLEEGAAASNRTPRAQATSGRAVKRIRVGPRFEKGWFISFWWNLQADSAAGGARPRSLNDLDRNGGRHALRPGSDLPVATKAPAIHRTVSLARAGVSPASIESCETERTGDGERRQPIESAAVSDLTIAIRAPAVDSVVGRQPAGVKSGGGHRQEAQPTRDGCWGPLVGRAPMMAVAKLAPARRPPAIGGAAARHPTRVKAAAGHGGEAQPAGDQRGAETVGIGAVTQPAEAIAAPAIRGASRRHAARMVDPGAHGAEGEGARDGSWGRAVGRRAVAELAVEIATPAVNGAARGQPAGMLEPSTDVGENLPARDTCRPGVRGIGPIAKLPVDIR